jgi:hypothetical protein
MGCFLMQRNTIYPRSRSILHKGVLLVTPVVFGILQLGHPLLNYQHTISMLAPITTRWILLHLLFIPLYILMGWAFYLLLEGIHSFTATVARYTAIVYVAFAIGYDTVVGLNAGILVSEALSSPSYNSTLVPWSQV